MNALAGAANTAANLAWKAFQAVNTRIPDSPSIEPEWAPGPLPKSYERTKPPLGWPRETDSLCPECVIEVRDAIIAGERDLSELTESVAAATDHRLDEDTVSCRTRGAPQAVLELHRASHHVENPPMLGTSLRVVRRAFRPERVEEVVRDLTLRPLHELESCRAGGMSALVDQFLVLHRVAFVTGGDHVVDL